MKTQNFVAKIPKNKRDASIVCKVFASSAAKTTTSHS